MGPKSKVFVRPESGVRGLASIQNPESKIENRRAVCVGSVSAPSPAFWTLVRLRRRRLDPSHPGTWQLAIVLVLLLTLNAFGQEGPRAADELTQIYVPAEDFASIFARDKRGVLLPRGEFEKLLEQARKNERETPDIPNGIAVTKAEYRATIAGSQLVIKSFFELTQVADGWRSLRLGDKRSGPSRSEA